MNSVITSAYTCKNVTKSEDEVDGRIMLMLQFPDLFSQYRDGATDQYVIALSHLLWYFHVDAP
jgi:hypothetical protein